MAVEDLRSLNYCNVLCVRLPLKRFQLVQNAAARMLTGVGHRDHIILVLVHLHDFPVSVQA